MEEQLNEFKSKQKEEYYRYKQRVNDDAGEKDESTDKSSDQFEPLHCL